MKIKKTYAFTIWTALYITIFTAVSLFLFTYLSFGIWPRILLVFLFILIVFIFTFLVIQYRYEKLIHRRIKKIYDAVSILDSTDFKKPFITSDITKLSKQVEKFAEDKQQQIQMLNMRESYRREFIGNISHELKTPLFTVQSYLLTLVGGAIKDKQIRIKYLKRANKAVDRLIAIVKDLDLISKLELNDLNLNRQPFNIIALIQGSIELLEMNAKKRNISLLLDKKNDYPIMVIGDVERIEQVITNLIVNSINYGKSSGTTLVSVTPFEKNKMLIKVADDGEGIQKMHQSRIFERFYRVDQSRSREQGGSGLGLSIVKHIIEAHNEQIFVNSTYKKGSEFSFTIEKFE